MVLDLAILSRIQFAFTIGFHIIWPTITIGLGLFLLILETLWLKKHDSIYKELYQFWAKIFALAFGMGVVTGLPLAYQFGTNFSGLSETAGNIIGPLMSVEVMTAFFLEAAFIGVMLFGWQRVPPIIHYIATICVVVGTHNSAFWIIVTNSWMQTPSGTEFIKGVFEVTDWHKIIFNPSMPYRLTHSLLSSYISASLLVVGVSAWYLLKKRELIFARRAFSMGIAALCILVPLQIVMGDLHGLQVKRTQPVKVAAMEGLWDTSKGVPLVLFAIPDVVKEQNNYVVSIPKLTSFILTHEWDGEVLGLKNWPKEERPPVSTVFYSFRIMVGLGFWFLLIGFVGLLARNSPIYQRLCILTAPFGIVATICGWIVAEVGRQPYCVYGYLKTKDAVSLIVPEAVLGSLIGFIVTYSIMLFAFLFYCRHLIKKGPAAIIPPTNHEEAEWLHLATHTTHLTQDRKGEI